MKKIRSIAFLLSMLTGLTVALLVSVFSLVAMDAYDKRQTASILVSDIGGLKNILKAEELVLLIQGRMGTVLEAHGPASPKSLQEITNLRSDLRSALDASVGTGVMRTDLASRSENIKRTYAALEGIWTKALGTLDSPDWKKRAALSEESMHVRVNLSNALKDKWALLAVNLDSIDPILSEVMKIERITLKMREDAGSGRRAIVQILTAGTKPNAIELAQIAESDGRIDSPWAVIMADLNLPVVSDELRQAITQANRTYFSDYRKLRREVLASLTDGKPSKFSANAWLVRTDSQVNDITRVAFTGLDLSYAHVSAQLAAAQEHFYVAIGLMALSLGLALITIVVVTTRIIRPLSDIAQAMEIIADGNLEHKIPFKTRQDEIGRFARALKTFRETAREKQQMESELLRNQMARETAEASNRIKSEFLANMSHELRTPLNAVIGFSDIMQQKLFGPLLPQYEEYAGIIHESGEHLLNLVSDILDVAKIEAGKFTLDFQNVDLANAVASCVRLIKSRAEDRGITIKIALPAHQVNFMADPRALKQILLNLLSNAVKFTHEGGQVEVTGEVSGETIKITVRDNGIGIPSSALSRIGHAFEQASNDPTRAREGTGLGLALVRALIAQHGGTFSIDSIEHVGTTVSFELPFRPKVQLAA